MERDWKKKILDGLVHAQKMFVRVFLNVSPICLEFINREMVCKQCQCTCVWHVYMKSILQQPIIVYDEVMILSWLR